jgi:phage host-nuclease inhibitor protein Gam
VENKLLRGKTKMKKFVQGRKTWESEEPTSVDPIKIIADTHEPGSLETLLWAFERLDTVFSTGDHIPSGMHSPDRKVVDRLKSEGVTDIQAELLKLYNEDHDYRAAVDAHYQKTIANLAIRRYALEKAEVDIVSCAGNQDFIVGRKLKKHGYTGDLFNDFRFYEKDPETGKYSWGLQFEFKPFATSIGKTGILLVPYDEERSKDQRPCEEISAGIAIDKDVTQDLSDVSYVILLSHQSVDPTGMGVKPETVKAYTDSGNMALIKAYYQFARDIVGPKNVQLVHGHHHAQYRQYDFQGSRVHNLNIGDLLLVDPENFETKVKYVVPY